MADGAAAEHLLRRRPGVDARYLLAAAGERRRSDCPVERRGIAVEGHAFELELFRATVGEAVEIIGDRAGELRMLAQRLATSFGERRPQLRMAGEETAHGPDPLSRFRRNDVA